MGLNPQGADSLYVLGVRRKEEPDMVSKTMRMQFLRWRLRSRAATLKARASWRCHSAVILAVPEQQQPTLVGARNSSTTCCKAFSVEIIVPAGDCQIRQHPKIHAQHVIGGYDHGSHALGICRPFQAC
jgi:hypothetical protein